MYRFEPASGSRSPRSPPLSAGAGPHELGKDRLCVPTLSCRVQKPQESCSTVNASGDEYAAPSSTQFIGLTASVSAVPLFKSCRMVARKGAVAVSSLSTFGFGYLSSSPRRQLLVLGARPPRYHYRTEITEPGSGTPSRM